MRDELIKKINNLAIIDIKSFEDIRPLTSTIVKLLNYSDSANMYSIVSRLSEIFNENDYKNMEEIAILINICECRNTIDVLIIDEDTFEIIPLNELSDTREQISIDDFQYFNKDKYTIELMKIENITGFERFGLKKKMLKKFKKKYLDELKKSNIINSNKIVSKYEAMVKSTKINIEVNKYNKLVEKLFDTPFAIKSKKLLAEFEIDSFGYMEIDMGIDGKKDEELITSFYADYCFVSEYPTYFGVGYEGCSIFAEATLQNVSYFYDAAVQKISKQLYDDVSECECVPHAYELIHPENEENNDLGKLMFDENEVIGRLKMQMYLLEKNADKIFKGLYKLLNIIKTQKIIEGSYNYES